MTSDVPESQAIVLFSTAIPAAIAISSILLYEIPKLHRPANCLKEESLFTCFI
jgi:hypothetical protein